MQELIKVTQNEQGSNVVSAKELHSYLEVQTRFDMWIQRMFEYGFDEGKDFCTNLCESNGGRPLKDYALTLDTAKEISMLQRTEKGKQARQYFIECEKQLKQPKKLSRLEILTLALEAEKRVVELEEKVLLDKPKVEFYDEVADSTTSFDMQEVSAMLKLDYGRNTLFRKLREVKVLMGDNLPYRSFIDDGKFVVVEAKWLNPRNQQSTATFQTRITQKGLEWLQKNKNKFRL